jgi:hypothetical protein
VWLTQMTSASPHPSLPSSSYLSPPPPYLIHPTLSASVPLHLPSTSYSTPPSLQVYPSAFLSPSSAHLCLIEYKVPVAAVRTGIAIAGIPPDHMPFPFSK